jgi:hypothetical protein
MVKSVKYKETPTQIEKKQYHFLMEFSKSLTPEELKEVQTALKPPQGSGKSSSSTDAFRLMLAAPKKDGIVRAELRALK